MSPVAFLEVGIVVVAGLSAAAVHAIIRRRVDYRILAKHNDVAGFVFSAIGVLYAVVLGFVVVVVWEKYDDAQTHVDKEVSAAADLYRAVVIFPEPLRDRLRASLRDYAQDVSDREWPQMQNRTIRTNAISKPLEAFSYPLAAFNATTEAQTQAHRVALEDFRSMLDARRERLDDTQPSVPPLLWFALIAGAIAMLAFAFLFGVESLAWQLVMTGMLAAVIAVLFIVIWEFDAPFSGSTALTPQGWHDFLVRVPYIR
jgi:hypothetical protein